MRLGESIGVVASSALQFVLAGKLRKYRPIRAEILAAAMLAAVQGGKPGRHIYHYDEIVALSERI